MASSTTEKLKILVSSSVYGHEDLLDLIYSTLTILGYEVWMSHAGTVQVFSNRTAFDNCMDAVEKCDLFLSFITKNYGSGRETAKDISITHRELRRAIELNKPRWVLAHHDVIFARSFLQSIGIKTAEDRGKTNLMIKKPIDDLRVIDMYEEATRSDIGSLKEREGNWVQKFYTDYEALLFTQAQFHRYQDVESFVREQFSDEAAILREVKARKGDQP